MTSGGLCRWVIVAWRPTTSLGHLQRILQGRRGGEPRAGAPPGLAAHDDDLAGVRQAVAAPVPHVEGVHAVVGVARAVQVAVPLVLGELLLVAGLDLDRIGRVGQHLLEEVDVAGVVDGVELPRRGVAHDHHAALAHQRPAPVHVEEVAEPQAHDQDRVHHRVDVVGADVGQPHRQDVGLALDRDQLLAEDVLGGDLVHGLDLAGLHRRDAVGRRHDWKILRRALSGMRSRPAFMATNDARSLAVHSHSRFCSTAIGPRRRTCRC